MVNIVTSRAAGLADKDDEEEETAKGEKMQGPGPQLAQILFKNRTILLMGEIDMRVAKEITAQMLALAVQGDDDIKLVINSPGGHVESGDTIHDMIKFVTPKVKVLGTGWVASAGAHIFLAAPKEDRYCLPNTRFMLHQPLGGVGGKASDIDIEAREIIKMRRRINETISEATGQPIEKVEKDTDRNFWMGAAEARDYGVVTHIISAMKEF
ncbi:MAG: ATP-dependent Clp protease proteolytic subunit [Azospirillaceae bacterium]